MNLTEKAMLATLSIRGIWSAVAEDERVTAEVAQHYQVSEDLGRYLKKICDPKKVASLKTFNTSRTTLYNLHRQLTLPWDDKGTRMLPSAMYFDYMQKMQEAKQRVVEAYGAFLTDMPMLKGQARTVQNGLFREQDWPDPDELLKRVNIRVRITPLADASDFRVQLGAEEEAKIKDQVSKDMFATLAGALADLVTRLKVCVQDAQERISRYEIDAKGKTVHRFHDSAITNLRKLIALVPKLNVINDPTLNALTQEIETLLCQHDPQTLRDNYIVRKKVVEDATSIAGKLAAVESILMSNAEAA